MAELKNNPLGALSGKLGNMVASSWRDINYLRAGSKGSKKGATDDQMEIRARFKLMQEFLMQIKDVVEIGFNNKYTGRSTALNIAAKVNSAAITGDYPEIEIDYPAITLSTGALNNCLEAKIEAIAGTKVRATWDERGVPKPIEAFNLVNILLYDVKRQAPIFYNNFLRSDYTAEINLPASFADDLVHGWLFFTTPDGERISKTNYLGSVTILA